MEDTATFNTSNGNGHKKVTLKEWQKSVISTTVTSLFTGAILCIVFYFNTKYELADHDTRINTLENRTTAVENNIASMKTDIGRMQVQIEDINVQLKEMRTDISQMQQDVQKIYQILLEKK